MKRIKSRLVLLMLCFLFSASSPMTAMAGEYLGELCWNFNNMTEEISGVLRIGVEHIGDGHYLCSGKAIVESPVSLVAPVFGNAEIVEGEIVITLTVPGRRDGTLGSQMISISLNSNFDGTFESIGIYSDATEVSVGTLTYTTCP